MFLFDSQCVRFFSSQCSKIHTVQHTANERLLLENIFITWCVPPIQLYFSVFIMITVASSRVAIFCLCALFIFETGSEHVISNSHVQVRSIIPPSYVMRSINSIRLRTVLPFTFNRFQTKRKKWRHSSEPITNWRITLNSKGAKAATHFVDLTNRDAFVSATLKWLLDCSMLDVPLIHRVHFLWKLRIKLKLN